LKCAIYVRLSQEDKNKEKIDDDSRSIQNQKTMLVQHALQENWEIYNIYSDDDYTGADRHRPQFNQLLQDAKNKQFDIILCKTQSRFTRELEMVEKYINYLFPIWGIRFVSIVDNADTTIKGNKKSRQINGLVNEWYLEDISENIKSVLNNKKHNGKHIGSFALYGYKKDPSDKGHLIIDQESAEIVREVFSMFIQGYGKTAIARFLNDRGIPSPTEYKRLNGLNYRANGNASSVLWRYATISNMLRNEMYIGNMVQNKSEKISYKSKKKRNIPKKDWIIVKNTHDPIIDIDTWNKTQELISLNTKPFNEGKIGLFANKVYCKHCNYALKSSKIDNRRYLQCQTKYVAKDSCIGSFVAVKTLEEIVLKELKQLINELLDEQAISENIELSNDINTKTKRLKKDIVNYEKKLNDVTKSSKNLYIDKVNEVITNEEYIMLSQEFKNDKSKYEKLINDYKEQLVMIENQINDNKDKIDIVKQYTNINKLNREIVETLIDRIYVSKRNKETKELSIEIHWNF